MRMCMHTHTHTYTRVHAVVQSLHALGRVVPSDGNVFSTILANVHFCLQT